MLKWASSGVVGGVVSSTSGQSLSCLTASGESEAQGALTSEDIGWLRQLAVFAVAQAASDLRAQNNKGPDRDKPTEFDEDDVPPSDIVDPEALVQWALDRAAVRLQLGRAGGISEGNFVKGFSVFLVLGPPCKWEATAESEPGCLGFKGAEVWKEVYDWYGVRYRSKSDGLAVSEGLVTTSWCFFESLEGLEVWNGLSEFKGWPVFGEWSPELVFKVLGCWNHWKHERHHTDEVAARRLLLAKLTEEELMKRHVGNDHIPFRKGCPVCIQAQGRQRSHWRSSVTSVYSLSCDIAGPFKDGLGFDPVASGRDKGRGYRYFLAAAYSVPVEPVEIRPEFSKDVSPVEGELEEYEPSEIEGETGSAVRSCPALAGDGESLHAEDEELCQEVLGGLGAKALFRRVKDKVFPAVEPLDPSTSFAVPGTQPGDELPGEGTGGVGGKVKTRTLFMGIPLKSKRGAEVMAQVQALVNRLETAGFPIHKYFSDRAKELRSHALIGWFRHKGIHPESTSGEDPAGNKAEVAVKHLKQDARKLLRAADLPTGCWPLAIMHASRRNFVQLCEQLHLPQPALIQFGTRLHARKRLKTGHKKHWEPRTFEATYVGVAPDCAGGHLVMTTEKKGGRKVHLTNTVYPLVASPPPPKPRFRFKDKGPPTFAVRTVTAIQN